MEDYQFSKWTQAVEEEYQRVRKKIDAENEARRLQKENEVLENRALIAALNQANESEHKKWLQMNPHVVCKCRTCDQHQ